MGNNAVPNNCESEESSLEPMNGNPSTEDAAIAHSNEKNGHNHSSSNCNCNCSSKEKTIQTVGVFNSNINGYPIEVKSMCLYLK